jgi:adenylate cyclase class 2
VDSGGGGVDFGVRGGEVMPFEIEMKFKVDSFAQIEAKLAKGGGPYEEVETDIYYAHPCRSFKDTGEALRLRSMDTEEHKVLCYKSGKSGDGVKSKREIEIPIDDQYAGDLEDILQALGFTESITVEKCRRSYSRRARDYPVTICLDDVKDLGEFVEVEIVCEEDSRHQAEEVVKAVADKLGLKDPVTKGYAAMMHELKSKVK